MNVHAKQDLFCTVHVRSAVHEWNIVWNLVIMNVQCTCGTRSFLDGHSGRQVVWLPSDSKL